MKKFIIRCFLFVGLFLLIISLAFLLIPNKRIVNNSLYSNIDKHIRIDSLTSPKIVFIGGSNLCFGLNSEAIECNTEIPVVNMGLHAGFGVYYMLNEIRKKVQAGDIIIFSPEYDHFYNEDLFYGEKVLVALVFEVNRKNLEYITLNQFIHFIPNIVKYSVSKMLNNQLDIMDEGDVVTYERYYKRNSFNKYGDDVMHWDFPNEEIIPRETATAFSEVSKKTLKYIRKFKDEMQRKDVRFIVVPPAYQCSSFLNNETIITQIADEMNLQGMPFEIRPETFAYPDSLFFNTVYHLNKKGVDERTNEIIVLLDRKIDQDIKSRN